GTDVATLVVWPQVSDPMGIAVNPAGGKLYWCQSAGNDSRILNANLDGSSPTTVLSWPQVLDPKSISLDLLHLKMYWAAGASTSTRLVRAGLDGSGVETIVTWPQASDVFGLDVVYTAPIPTVSEWGMAVMILLVLVAGTLLLLRRDHPACCE
ncbi:MAG: hypothetical protein AAB385_08225, partial [Planctomycetota bacterium]